MLIVGRGMFGLGILMTGFGISTAPIFVVAENRITKPAMMHEYLLTAPPIRGKKSTR
jgi:hypothetical protein